MAQHWVIGWSPQTPTSGSQRRYKRERHDQGDFDVRRLQRSQQGASLEHNCLPTMSYASTHIILRTKAGVKRIFVADKS